jgi:antitoxin component YwqK of YwqJK toxin-antitoxin module
MLLSPSAVAQDTLRVIRLYHDKVPALRQEYQAYWHDTTKLHGFFTEYFENGKPKSKGTYRNGKAIGLWEYYYESGMPKATGEWNEQKPTGSWTYYFENGSVSSKGSMEAGNKTGSWYYFYESGQKKYEGIFEQGLRQGVWKYFYEDGTAKASATYDRDTASYQERSGDGTLLAEGMLSGGRSFGRWNYYYPSGKLKSTGTELNGRREGLWMRFFESGKLASEGMYKMGKTSGNWTYYHENGTVAAQGVELDGMKEGTWKLFLENGFLKSEVQYQQGTAPYEEFYENGKLKVKGKIVKGVHQGLWEYFYEDGTPEGKCIYRDGVGTFYGYYPNGALKTEGMLKNGDRMGMWKLYDSKGELEGYYIVDSEGETTRNTVSTEEQDADSFKPGITKATVSPRLGKKRPPLRYFYSTANEFRSIVISSNPLSIFLDYAFLQVEYYMEQRLGYELGYTYYRIPFFETRALAEQNRPYGQGFSIDFKQKFYSRKRSSGMLYFAHEPRYTRVQYSTRYSPSVSDPSVLAIADAIVQRYEYSILLGYRIMRKTDQRGLIVDLFVGQSAGYRSINRSWSNNAALDVIFNEIGSEGTIYPVRVGFNIGFAF